MNKKNLIQQDPEIAGFIEEELQRRRDGLEMIPSENHTSLAVLEALGSILTDKYSEGYPGKRYYAGNEFIDKIENLALQGQKRPLEFLMLMCNLILAPLQILPCI